jgi:hypothetical protein
VPSFVTPAAVRDQVDFVQGNLDQNLVGMFFVSFLVIIVDGCIIFLSLDLDPESQCFGSALVSM